MSEILKIKDFNKGAILKQGDSTTLKYYLYDADEEQIESIIGKTAEVVFIKGGQVYYRTSGVISDLFICEFKIEEVLPTGVYHIEFLVDGHIFPSGDKPYFTLTASSKGINDQVITAHGFEEIVILALNEVESRSAERLANLESNYATRLVDLETNDNALTAQLAQKATSESVLSFQNQLDSLVLDSGGTDADVIQAKVSVDGVLNTTLKERLDNDYLMLKSRSDKALEGYERESFNFTEVETGLLISDTGALNTTYSNRAYAIDFVSTLHFSDFYLGGEYLASIRLYNDSYAYIPQVEYGWKKYFNFSNYPTAKNVRFTFKKSDDSVMTPEDIDKIQKLGQINLFKKPTAEYKRSDADFETHFFDYTLTDNEVLTNWMFSEYVETIEVPSGYDAQIIYYKDKTVPMASKKVLGVYTNILKHPDLLIKVKLRKIGGTLPDIGYVRKGLKVLTNKLTARAYGIQSSDGLTNDNLENSSLNYIKIETDFERIRTKDSTVVFFGSRYYDEDFNYLQGSSTAEISAGFIEGAKYFSLNIILDMPSSTIHQRSMFATNTLELIRNTDTNVLPIAGSLSLELSTITDGKKIGSGFSSLMLVAVKMIKEEGKQSYSEGFLYLDVFDDYKFYYSQGVPDKLEYLFSWDGTKTTHAPTEYNCFIADNGDMIFAYKNELFKDVRNPAIVYTNPNYEATVISFSDKNNPVGWLQNSGVDYVYADKSILFAEYIRSTSNNMRVWKVGYPYDNPENWNVVLELERSHIGEEVGLKHFHTVEIDPYSNFIYAFTGDDEEESRVYISKDNGNTFTLLKAGPEKHLRVLNLIFTPDNIYWGTDGGRPNYHIFIKTNRNSENVVDFFDSLEEVYQFPNFSVRFSTYSTVLINEPKGILFLTRFDAPTTEKLPVYFYDLTTNEMSVIATYGSLLETPIMYGFRNETVSYYQSYADDRIVVGFANYPNNMDMLHNTPSAVDNIIGISTDYLTNRKKINNVTLRVRRQRQLTVDS